MARHRYDLDLHAISRERPPALRRLSPSPYRPEPRSSYVVLLYALPGAPRTGVDMKQAATVVLVAT